MNKFSAQPFNPQWRDDCFIAEALEIPLLFPHSSRDADRDSIWVQKNIIREEFIFERRHQYDSYQQRVAIVKPSETAKHYTMRNAQGEEINDTSLFAGIFPPKAWMTDNGEERCMMFNAAQLASGHVLMAGLGLAIYPQLIFSLKRPVKSITIIENNPKVIELVAEPWLSQADYPIDHIHIIESTIEDYCQNKDNNMHFDTIYLDVWEDADPRFLAYVNYLIELARPHCAKDGQIQCWGYAKMLQTFLEVSKALTEQNFPFDDYHLDPALEAYVQWLKTQNKADDLSEEAITNAARHYALSTQKPLNDYHREHCLSTFALSRVDFYRNLALAKKRT